MTANSKDGPAQPPSGDDGDSKSSKSSNGESLEGIRNVNGGQQEAQEARGPSGFVHVPDNPSGTQQSDTVNPMQGLLFLGIKCGCQRQMHRLAEVYYLERDKWLHFLPLTILTLISGVLAFMASTTLFEGSQEILTLLVGFTSLVSVAIQSCAKNSKYAAKSEMHRIAALQMQKVTDNIEFHQIDPESASKAPKDDKDDKFALRGSITEKIESCRASYNQIMNSCDSTIPTAIAQGFDMVDSRLTICLDNNTKFKNIVKSGQGTSEQIMYISVYNELYSEYSNAFGWPWRIINPHHAVNRAVMKVNNNYNISDQFLSEDYDMDEGVGALFSWACCCCMDAESWFWTYCRNQRLSQKKGQNKKGGEKSEAGNKGAENEVGDNLASPSVNRIPEL